MMGLFCMNFMVQKTTILVALILIENSLKGFRITLQEKETATHSSVLAWRIPGTGEPAGLLSMRSHRVGHD